MCGHPYPAFYLCGTNILKGIYLLEEKAAAEESSYYVLDARYCRECISSALVDILESSVFVSSTYVLQGPASMVLYLAVSGVVLTR